MLIQVMSVAAFAVGPPLENFCEPFNGKNCDVIWAAPSNLPASVKIYAVVPTKFSPSTISNLLQIAELTPKNKRRSTQDGVLGGKDVLVYANKKDTRHLDIIPSQGAIGLGIDGTIAQIPKEMPVGVPDDKEALRLVLDILGKIGISRSELATSHDGKTLLSFSEASVLHKDKSTGQIVTNVVRRGINLTRRIEGIPVWGDAGVSAKFGNEGKLAYLSVVWRAIKPAQDCPISNSTEFISHIKSGHALIRSEQAGTRYKKLTVNKVQLYYWENEGSKPQSTIYPFAVLNAKTGLPGENANLELFVPFANQ
ncbi:MAG: hypothetical protein ACR2H1_06220, partial [Limisphaerales bacterium]